MTTTMKTNEPDARCTRCTSAEIQLLKVDQEQLVIMKADKDGQTTIGVVVGNICADCIRDLQIWIETKKPRLILISSDGKVKS